MLAANIGTVSNRVEEDKNLTSLAKLCDPNACALLSSASFRENTLKNSILSPEQYEALLAAGPKYQIEILTKNFEGKPRIIVILGELHVTDKLGADLAQAVIDLFPFRATEGIFVENYPFPKLYKAYLKDLRTAWHNNEDPEIKPGAIRISHAKAAEASFAQSHFIDEFIKAVEEASTKMLAGEKQVAINLQHLFDTSPLPKSKLIDIIKCILSSGDDSPDTISKAIPAFSVRYLELAHKPTGVEKLDALLCSIDSWIDRKTNQNSFLVPIILGGFVNLSSVLCLAFSDGLIARSLFVLSAIPAAIFYSLLIRRNISKIPMLNRKINSFTEKLDNAAIQSRDSTMADECCHIMNDNPEIPQLLVQCGKDHVNGVMANLIKSGWEKYSINK